MLARDVLQMNNWVFDCPHCGLPNWEYIGPKPIMPLQTIKARHFRGLGDVPNPSGTDEIVCHFCKKSMILEDKKES